MYIGDVQYWHLLRILLTDDDSVQAHTQMMNYKLESNRSFSHQGPSDFLVIIKMARFVSVGLMLILACWTASSNGAAISLEDKIQQLTDSYVSQSQLLKLFKLTMKCIYSKMLTKSESNETRIDVENRSTWIPNSRQSSSVNSRLLLRSRSAPFSTKATP